jgi:hypothetical protein
MELGYTVAMDMSASHFAGELRRELCARNAVYAVEKRLTHVPSYGEVPVTVYAPEVDGLSHGNFYAASYRAIVKREEWARRKSMLRRAPHCRELNGAGVNLTPAPVLTHCS